MPQGLAWLGNIRVAGAPYTATFVATIGLDDWGAWQGPLYGGQIRAESNVTLVVKATNLQPNATYIATWLGISDNADQVGPASATASPATPAAFATASFMNLTVPVAATYTGPIVPCSNVKGALYRMFNHATDSCTVELTWYNDAAGTLTLAGRQIIIPAVAIAVPGSATFTHPHLGNYVQVSAVATTGNLALFIAAAHHDSDAITWSDLLALDGAAGELSDVLLSGSSALTGGAGSAVLNSSQSVYAGPVGVSITSGAVKWNVQLQTLDASGNWVTIYQWDQTVTPSLVSVVIPVPPAPLRTVGINNDAGGAHNIGATIVADSWRG